MLRLIKVAIASLMMVGCGSQNRTPYAAAEETPSSGEVAAPSGAVIRFTPEEPGAPDVGPVRLHIREAGKVSLPNGTLAVSDAFVNDSPLIVAGLADGEYAVELLVADAESDQRVAATRMRLTTEPPASWRRVGYFPVDSGNGALFDPRISASIGPSNVDSFNRDVMKALEESYRHTYSTANLSWQGMTFVGFSTGWGDGRYPVYVGLSAAGVPTSVVVDCEILPWPK